MLSWIPRARVDESVQISPLVPQVLTKIVS